jgi:hypothetical protein
LTTELIPLINLLIAVFVAVIAGFQWRTARLQWKTTHNRAVFDLFERRYTIYKTFREVQFIVIQSGQADRISVTKALAAAEEAQFLFGDDILNYIKKFTEDLTLLECLAAEQGEAGPGLANNVQ